MWASEIQMADILKVVTNDFMTVWHEGSKVQGHQYYKIFIVVYSEMKYMGVE